MAVAVSPRPSGPKTPGMAQLAVSSAFAILLATVALTTRQNPPPAIAEFAPQAVQQLKEAPTEQSSEFGSGEGDGDCPPGVECGEGNTGNGGPGGPSTTLPVAGSPSTTVAGGQVIEAARVKRCVGDPPRQIEDPQSPPCIPYWDDSQGNGGATSPGVTGDTIKVAVPNQAGFIKAFANFFNDRFQFYGRRIELVTVPVGSGRGGAGGTGAREPAIERSYANAAKEKGVFAATWGRYLYSYHVALADHKIISTTYTPMYTDSFLAEKSPYLWSYDMTATQILSNLGDWACSRLVGKPAKHAGVSDITQMSTQTRKFGIVMEILGRESTLHLDALKQALTACSAEVPYEIEYYDFALSSDPATVTNEVIKMKRAGVTTAFVLADPGGLLAFQSAADQQRYEPEWVISSYPQLFVYEFHQSAQMARTFGVSFKPMERVPEDHPSIWAALEGSGGTESYNRDGSYSAGLDASYRAFLQLASGFQMAGPNLTPETFKAGLQRAVFPNPVHPIMAGSVGFSGDFGMTDDGAEFWWSDTARGPYEGNPPGTFCWLDGGKRYKRGTWPRTDAPFFDPSNCDTGAKPVA